jgi:hypothetical protein
MQKNRRNYYRILLVQPEAPPELIRASYRTLMGPLRHHPDLGGDHEKAALLNEAYAVLGDPEMRRRYDLSLRKESWRAPSPAADDTAAEALAASGGSDPAAWAVERCCPFCRVALPDDRSPAARCSRCAAPLSVPPRLTPQTRELFGKRRATRFVKNRPVALVPHWGAAPVSAVMRDFSLAGIGLLAPHGVPVAGAIRIVDADFEAVATVVSSRPRGDRHSLHARFLTLAVLRQAGTIVSTRA